MCLSFTSPVIGKLIKWNTGRRRQRYGSIIFFSYNLQLRQAWVINKGRNNTFFFKKKKLFLIDRSTRCRFHSSRRHARRHHKKWWKQSKIASWLLIPKPLLKLKPSKRYPLSLLLFIYLFILWLLACYLMINCRLIFPCFIRLNTYLITVLFM